VDLIYGLPKQTAESFTHTLESVVRAKPDRIAAYSYAHLPEMFRSQRLIRERGPAVRRREAGAADPHRRVPHGRGYEYIGMDHFALPEDDLVRARRDGTLHRNFQGYSTHAELDLVGLGVSAIGKVGNSYAQNIKLRHDYYDAIDAGHIPILRGVELTPTMSCGARSSTR
jgi:oxygen-independent coproporphyrinogen III oxidase